MKISSVSKCYGGFAVLDDFTLELPKVGVTCLFGPSGCGKTTLLDIIAGLTPPDSGVLEDIPTQISYVFQDDRLLPWATALDNIAFVLPKERRGEAGAFLLQAGLPAEAHEKVPAALSGGMRRRVAFARALARGGELLLLDEPLKGLDHDAKEELYPILRRLTAGYPAILVTHDAEEAAALADTIHRLSGPPLKIMSTFPDVSRSRDRAHEWLTEPV